MIPLATFLLAYALGLLTAAMWAFVWWKRKQARLAHLLTEEAETRVLAQKSRTPEEAAVRCEAWLAAEDRLEGEVYP